MKTSKIIVMTLGMVSGFVFAESDYEAVVDDSVIGYWRFNDPSDYQKDSSGHGNRITVWNNTKGCAETSDWSRGGGCFSIPSAGDAAKATVGDGRGFSLNRESPGWTIAAWIRGASGFAKTVKGLQYASLGGEDTAAFKEALEDQKWHPIVIVFRPNRDGEYYRVYLNGFDSYSLSDITAGSGNDSPGHPAWQIPLSMENDMVTLGGYLGGSIKIITRVTIGADFFGELDDCIIINRELDCAGSTRESAGQGNRSGDEVFRFVQTGETFVYSKAASSGNMFYEAEGWSNGLEPQPGLAYIIENGRVVNAAKTATFAGKSLSVGRTEKLYGIKQVGGDPVEIVGNTVGKIVQKVANTELTVNDLVLNNGTFTSRAPGQKLYANIRVRASEANPFSFIISNGTYKVIGTMTGNGYIDKAGPEQLDLTGLTVSTAKVKLSEGPLRLSAANPTLAKYEGGTLIVDFDENSSAATTVSIETAWSGKLGFKLNGSPSKVGRYAVLEVPTSVKAIATTDFDNQTVLATGMVMRLKIVTEGVVQTVYAECLPEADVGGSPVVVFE